MIQRRTLMAALIAVAVATVPPPLSAAAPLAVAFVAPPAGQPVFGPIEVVLQVTGDQPVALVELWYQDRKVGARSTPPWQFQLDVGEDNIDRNFRAVVTGTTGGRAVVELLAPAIHVDEAVSIELQQLYVTVTRGGTRVLDLERDKFRVLDERDDQEIVTFERGDVPITAAILLDASASMRGAPLTAALRGARAFAGGMAELDQAMLLLFADRVLFRSPMSSDPSELERGLSGVRAAGGTAVNDHLFSAFHSLESQQGRRVIVILSDGVDVDSMLPVEAVRETAGRSQAVVYWLRLAGGPDVVAGEKMVSIWRNAEEHRDELIGLRRLVEATGGRVVDLASPDDAERAFAEVLAELREQYVIGYYPSNARTDGSWHRVDVRVDGSGNDVRSRTGYYDD